MNFIITWTSHVNYFAAFNVFVAHYAFVIHRPALHFGSVSFLLYFPLAIPCYPPGGTRRLILADRSDTISHPNMEGGVIPHSHVDFDVPQSVTTLKTLHAASIRATGSVAQVSVLCSSDSSTSRHPNLHHHRTQNRQVSNARRPVQLVFIQGFPDLPREPGQEEAEEEGG